MRLERNQREAVILTAAIRIARDHGLCAVNHGEVAKRCSIATSIKTVQHYFPKRASLWAAVVAKCPEFTLELEELGC